MIVFFYLSENQLDMKYSFKKDSSYMLLLYNYLSVVVQQRP